MPTSTAGSSTSGTMCSADGWQTQRRDLGRPPAVEPAAPRLRRTRGRRLARWRGWDSNPRSRAHEAREDSRSSTARRCKTDLAGRSRTCGLRFPKPAGWPAPLQPEVDQRAPPAGLEPAASGLRARRHRHFDHGGKSSGGRARTCALAGNNRASFQLDHAGTMRRKERESNPQSPRAHPFSKRDTAPVAVLPKVTPAGVEPATLRLRGGSSAS